MLRFKYCRSDRSIRPNNQEKNEFKSFRGGLKIGINGGKFKKNIPSKSGLKTVGPYTIPASSNVI